MSFFRNISFVLLLVSLITLGSMSAACDNNTPSITIEQSDEAAVYSAVIRQVYTHTTFNGTYQPSTLYIIRYTDDTVGDPDTKTLESKLITEITQSEISATLQDLPTEIVWMNTSDEVEKDSWRDVLDGGAIITIGNLHLQNDNSVQVPGSHFMSPTCGRGETYVIEFIEGKWEITGTAGTMWIS